MQYLRGVGVGTGGVGGDGSSPPPDDLEAGFRFGPPARGGSASPSLSAPVTPAAPAPATIASRRAGARAPADFAAATRQLQQQHEMFKMQQQAMQMQQAAHAQASRSTIPLTVHVPASSSSSSHGSSSSSGSGRSSKKSSSSRSRRVFDSPPDSDPDERRPRGEKSMRRRVRSWMRRFKHKRLLLAVMALAVMLALFYWRARIHLEDIPPGLSEHSRPSAQQQPATDAATVSNSAVGAAHEQKSGSRTEQHHKHHVPQLAMPSAGLRAHMESDPTIWRLEDETEFDRLLLNASAPLTFPPHNEEKAGSRSSSRRLSMQNFHNPLLRTRAPNAAELIAAEQAAAAAAAASAAAASVAAGGSPPASASSPPPPRPPFPVTIFTTMRDLTFPYQQANPLEYIKTWNALRSWRRLGWRDPPTVAADGTVTEGELHPPDVLLFVDHGPETCDHLRREKLLDMRGIQCITIPCFNADFKKPFMHCLWNLALAHARTDHLTFLNGDVVLLEDFWHSFQTAAHGLEHFVMVAQRRDVPPMDYPRAKLNYFIQVLDSDEEAPVDDDMGVAQPPRPKPKAGSSFVYEFPFHDPEWLLQFRRHVASAGVVHPDSGIDMFCFHRRVLEMFEFQHFLVGVYRWDNWLLAQLLLRSANSPYERTHGLEFHYAASHKFHGHMGVENDTHVAEDEDELGADNTLRHHSISFLVIDATACMSLIHDSFRSDHLRDAGASYADQLVKNKIGLRYRVGRIGNADLVMRVAAHNHEHKPEETDAMLAEDGCPHVCTGDATGMCYLEWNVATDRLDLQLVRQASTTGAVAVVTVSRPFLALASNFLCWYAQRARMGARQLIILAEDVASYRLVLSWDIDVPVLLFPEARDLPPLNSSVPVPTARESAAQFSAWRLSVIGRMLDQSFTVLLTDLDSLWFEQPWTGLGNFLALFQAEEFVSSRHAQYQGAALDQQEYKPIQVTQCTILAATKRVPNKGSKPVPPVAEALGSKAPPPQPTGSTTEMLSTSFMLLTPNRYSRYLWKKVQECSATVWETYPLIVSAAEHRAPCRYIEERCLHDLVRGMHAELTGSEFQTCKLPTHYFLEHNRLRMPRTHQANDDTELDPASASAATSSISSSLSGDDPESATDGPAAAPSTVVSGVVLRSVNRWTWANDPSVEVGASFLKMSARSPLQFTPAAAAAQLSGAKSTTEGEASQPAATAPPPLPPLEEVLGLSTHSEAGYFHPRLLHDWSSGGVEGLAAKVSRWKHSGLWCVFRPDLMHKALLDPSPPLALPFPVPTPLPAGAPPRPTAQGIYLRIHLHLSPAAGLTAHSLGAFLARLSTSIYPPQDTVDIELDLGEFRGSPREQERDAKRKERLSATTTGAGKPAVDAADSDSTAPADTASSRLTFSEIVDQFQKWPWTHGMKLLLPAVDASLLGDPSDPASMAAATKKRAALSPHELTMLQAQEDALRLRFRGEDWVVTYSYREGGSGGGMASSSTGADVPILLLSPAVQLSPSWFVFLRRQLSQWPKRHDELSGVERRWFGLSLMPLVDSVGDMEVATQGHPSGVEPYPPESAMLARVPRTETWDVHETGALQLLGQEYAHVEAERYRAEAGPGAPLNATQVSGRYWSGVQRTQLVNPLGLVVFSSSIHHLNSWKKAHYPAKAAAGATPSEAEAHSADYSLPCWARIITTDASTHTHAQAHYPHMTALLRYLFETGSFVTAPAPHAMGLARIAREISSAAEEDDTFTPSEASIQERERQSAADAAFDASTLFLPPALGALPLFDLSGASVSLPDTLAYRHHILKAAHGFGEYAATDTGSGGSTPPVDPYVGCPWPAMHPKLESTFYVHQSTTLE